MTLLRPHRRRPGQFEAYAAEISRHHLLTAAEERDLAREIAAGDADARDRLIRCNLRLVVNIARHYTGRGLAIDDLIQWGNLGLMRAAELYDPGRGVRFATYATYWVKQSIRWGVRDHGRTIRIPAYLQEIMGKIQAGKAVELTARQRKSLAAGFRIWNLHRVDDGDGTDGVQLADRLADGGRAIEDEAADADDFRLATRLLDDLYWREQSVIRLRFGVYPAARAHTLREVGRLLGMTPERVRQIEVEALGKLREAMAS